MQMSPSAWPVARICPKGRRESKDKKVKWRPKGVTHGNHGHPRQATTWGVVSKVRRKGLVAEEEKKGCIGGGGRKVDVSGVLGVQKGPVSTFPRQRSLPR